MATNTSAEIENLFSVNIQRAEIAEQIARSKKAEVAQEIQQYIINKYAVSKDAIFRLSNGDGSRPVKIWSVFFETKIGSPIKIQFEHIINGVTNGDHNNTRVVYLDDFLNDYEPIK